MFNIGNIKFKSFKDTEGELIPIESNVDIPFKIKRIYYISKVPNGIVRGFHAHRHLHQVLICVNGSVKIRMKIGDEEKIVELNNSSEGLYIGPLVWREMFDFTQNSVLLVLASEHFDETDYIRDYQIYEESIKKFLGR